MRDAEHARMMLDAARKDLAAIAGMSDPAVFDESIFGFHAQQAVEKALKAWLSLAGVAYPRTHDLEQLAALLAARRQTVPARFLALGSLTDFAVLFRYEAFDLEQEALDRPALVSEVRGLLAHVEGLVREAGVGPEQ